MTGLSPNQVVQLSEVLSIVVGVVIIWAVYYDSDRAELPGEAPIPAPGEVDDATPETTGRTLS
ncbi:MAG TPA: hypothetical protein VMH49_04715 [Thermoplasmata archaeon]|nr:hypothetical protein [Thermoplasmata archaeon]